ncbi:MAG: glycosyltransferase family 4 protein [Candidatus Latescibacteria bacterium]|nr:glycosyltransferase family 4 protein [Candidatus Latescibacterota bacterium]
MAQPQVLMIAYFFPPLGGAGVQRTVKFVKYLPGYGWDPLVLTVDAGTHIAYDPSMLNELPDNLPVYRTRAFDPEDLKGWWRGPFGQPGDSNAAPSTAPSSGTGHQRRWKTDLAHLYLRLIPWVCVPDRKVGWLPYACQMGRSVLSQRRIDLLFSTSSPITSHLIALRLKQTSGIPWVADFRDLWVSFPGHKPVTPLHGLIERVIERRIVTTADRVIANTEAARRVLLRDYPSVVPDRVVTIPNGFDEADFTGLQARQEDARFILTYTGNFYGNRNPRTLFHALTRLFTLRPDLRGRITVRFIGPGDPSLDATVRQHHLNDTVEIWPYQPHRKSLEALASSDVLLLIDAPEFNVNIPGKVFEYLRAGQPILALVPEGATADLLRETGGAMIVHPEDITAIADALLTLYDRRRTRPPEAIPNQAVVARFERRQLTGRLAEVFDQAYRRPPA